MVQNIFFKVLAKKSLGVYSFSSFCEARFTDGIDIFYNINSNYYFPFLQKCYSATLIHDSQRHT